jgi:hypothetical protein
VARLSKEKSEVLQEACDGMKEIHVMDKRISEELARNDLLERQIEDLKREQTRETWLLKNDIKNLEKANAELQEQLKEQKKSHQGKYFSL